MYFCLDNFYGGYQGGSNNYGGGATFDGYGPPQQYSFGPPYGPSQPYGPGPFYGPSPQYGPGPF